MTKHHSWLTPDLARAGRAIAQVSVDDLAEAAGLEAHRVRDFEKRGISLNQADNQRLHTALEAFGVLFLSEDSDAGYGVRRKHTASKTRQLKRWEGEGGPAFEDDI